MKKGIIIINLGSPESFEVSDVKKYLEEFLMDEKVIDYPFLLRKILVNGIIIPLRVKKSAHAYKSIWTKDGSPLKTITENFANILEKKIEMPVAIAMRYGNPTPKDALNELKRKNKNLEEILIAPMYPHYAMSSYETALEFAKKEILTLEKNIKLRFLKPFYREPNYISSLAASIKLFLEKQKFDAYLFSFHGLPIRHLKKADPTKTHCMMSENCCETNSVAWESCYRHQVKTTTQLVSEKLNLENEKVKITFQSRLGSEKWMQPFTDKTLAEFPKQKIKKILVICPAFVTDCLETLEEIDIRGKETFIKNGGDVFERVPCLNTSTEWVKTFSDYCINAELDYNWLWTE